MSFLLSRYLARFHYIIEIALTFWKFILILVVFLHNYSSDSAALSSESSVEVKHFSNRIAEANMAEIQVTIFIQSYNMYESLSELQKISISSIIMTTEKKIFFIIQGDSPTCSRNN